MNDDELLAHLKATDPALTSKAPRPDVTRLVEATMNTDTASTDTRTSTAGAGPRRRLVPALAFAALLVVGGGVTWGVAANGGDATRDTTGSGTVTAAPRTRSQPLTLTLADSGSAKCAAPTLQFLLSHQLAFEGTVTAKRGDRVDLTVDHWYRATTGTADRPDEVRLTSDEGNAEATIFEVGTQYLVTADDGAVPICGGTSVATAETRTMFQQAFGAPAN
ncbi:hypothetical protein ACKI1I_02300 [Streptomyces turgidiscabies]|uniref:Uncharacterized protein n=1 Tax=Streptomyces turgidiscabies (strain Car8) TaxID=698760 RepID=L7FKV2_STRT8|nr:MULTISPECIES: hypothetical protein [Streptomyces]ELP71290.1 hypothetical protein STRTUCAR8_05412 [Streptomyces turgidiscabies Car8]MDX3492272.1 hypothetical protein [Streptomyces turgidiscabies]GAQ69436.1 hypothetical protein T45_01161 [Streptomyces turgidiscabies]